MTEIPTSLLRTPAAAEAEGGRRDPNRPGATMRLSDQVAEEQARGILLPTPTTGESKSARRLEHDGTPIGARTNPTLTDVVGLLPTPTATDSEGARRLDLEGHPLSPKNGASLSDLPALLPTPTTGDGRGGRVMHGGNPTLLGVTEGLRDTDRERHPGFDDSTLLPTPTAGLGESGQTSRSGARQGELLLGGIAQTLLPTPAASLTNDGEDAAQWQARRDHHASKAEGATRAGMPLPIAVQAVGDDGILDDTADGERVAWGKYRAAILRAQIATGRLAPSPTIADGRSGARRLSARFVEWMMHLSPGHVVDVPGLSRGEQLRMLGNGVVPDQAEAAMVILLGRACDRLRAARRDQEPR